VPDGPLPFPVKVETHNITYSTSHEKGIWMPSSSM
jgi:hypothetical protein